jgi:hypothetical protein
MCQRCPTGSRILGAPALRTRGLEIGRFAWTSIRKVTWTNGSSQLAYSAPTAVRSTSASATARSSASAVEGSTESTMGVSARRDYLVGRPTTRRTASCAPSFAAEASYRRRAGTKRWAVCGPFCHGASRTRTGDLLGAISALGWPEFGLTSGFSRLRVSSPNTFPNSLQPVLQYDNALLLRTSRTIGTRPVTPEVAGSSPVAVSHFYLHTPGIDTAWRVTTPPTSCPKCAPNIAVEA